MGNFYTSEGQLKVGDKGEKYILNFLRNRKGIVDVIHLTGDKYKHLRDFDIDYVCSFRGKIDDNILLKGDISEINQNYLTVELKTDTEIHRTGNMFLEDYLIRDKDSKIIQGYMNKCKAKLFLYYDIVNDKIYGCDFSKLKSYYDKNKSKLLKPKYPTRSEIVGTRDKCKVYGYLVKVSYLIHKDIVKQRGYHKKIEEDKQESLF